MTCNFPAPVGGKPALFSHDDVITLFHEFGHGLHLLLTEVATLGISGFGHVEWDAVELPSQFMENYCWEWDVLSHMTQHAETGEPLLAFGRSSRGSSKLAQVARRCARRSVGAITARLQPYAVVVRTYFWRWLRGGLLQLQMG